jgi:transcriptional regulator with XRE-family HTH domain
MFFIKFAAGYNLIMMSDKPLNRIKVVLVENQKTNKWLAEQLGVSAVTVSKWCSNIHQPDLQTLNKIAEIIDCDMRQLIIGKKE